MNMYLTVNALNTFNLFHNFLYVYKTIQAWKKENHKCPSNFWYLLQCGVAMNCFQILLFKLFIIPIILIKIN